MTLVFPWPSRVLHPNSRPHWAALAKAKKAQRLEWFMLARKQGAKPLIVGPVRLAITFAPKTRHAQDVDGCLASIKAGLDGLADILCVDDSEFRITPTMTDPVKGGRITIEVDHP